MLDVAGLVPLSTTDFPGKLAAVVTLHGCPWECSYCSSPGLQPRPAVPNLAWADVMAFLESRRGLLDAVVFSGGEPTVQAALPRAAGIVRRLGYQIGVHTAGSEPRRLAQLLPHLDWVGFDVKGPVHAYPDIVSRVTAAASVLPSLELVLESRIPCEIRTTWHAGLFSPNELLGLARDLAGRGVRDYTLQHCEAPVGAPPYAAPPAALLEQLRGLFPRFTYRGQEVPA